MNSVAFTDYQRPIRSKNDYRTSSYRAHVFIDDTMMSRSKETRKVECKAFQSNTNVEDEVIGEHKRNYTIKHPDPTLLRNPSLSGKSVQFMKNYEETRLRSAPKPLQEKRSVYNNDFKAQSQRYAEIPPKLISQSAVKIADKMLIERTKPGYAKYLDTSATTNRLDYISYSPQQRLGIGANDNITFWSWIKKGSTTKYNVWPIKEQLCDKFKATKCPKRRNEFRNVRKAVPNAGLTTETKSNYLKPETNIGLHFNCTPTELIHCDIVPIQKRTENSIYGSGDRLEKFIDTRVNGGFF